MRDPTDPPERTRLSWRVWNRTADRVGKLVVDINWWRLGDGVGDRVWNRLWIRVWDSFDD